MNTPVHLEIPSVTVAIGDEEFTLVEMPAARLVAFSKVIDAAKTEEMADSIPEEDGPERDAWLTRSLSRANAPIRFLLERSDEWIERNMVRSTKHQLLDIQGRLNFPEGDDRGNG